ncbi:MAG: glycosyltransferase family 39 protein [Pirellulales bacterium]|nr:glycosyltransferase family 39 protein [Pirellulales bacterium]
MAALLILPNLGGTCLWADEGDTAVFAQSILVNGVPKAWDGRTFTDSDGGKRLNEQLIQVVHPWVPFYLAAASIGLLGDTSFAARLPFALAGIATAPLLYWLGRRLGMNRRTACLAVVLLLLSVQFLIYTRQARHYSLNMMLSCLMLYLALDLDKRWGRVAFAVTAIVLFHCHPLPALALLGAVGCLAVAVPELRKYAVGCVWTFPVIVLCTVPWLTLSVVGLQQNSAFPQRFEVVGYRLWQFFVEISDLLPWLLWLALLPWVLWRGDRAVRTRLAIILVALAAIMAVTVATQSWYHMWDLGLRYACAWLPLGALVTATLIAEVSRGAVWIEVVLVAICTLTHWFDDALPWLVLKPRTAIEYQFHLPGTITSRLFRTEVPAFLPEYWSRNAGVVTSLSAYLRGHAKRDDLLITNYEWEPLYFHTGLKQAYKVLPQYDCVGAARRHNLPEYVFSTQGARWVVWRPIWDGYMDYRLTQVRQELEQQGARLQLVHDVRDTRWENREGVHFRRFPNVGQLYFVWLGPGKLGVNPDWGRAQIYRVTWPDANPSQPRTSD